MARKAANFDLSRMTKQDRWKERRRMRGECLHCGEPSQPGKTLCADCAERSIRRCSRKRRDMRNSQRCLRCHHPLTPLDIDEGRNCHLGGDCPIPSGGYNA